VADLPVAVVKEQFASQMIVPDVAKIRTPVGVDATAEGVLPTPLYPVRVT